MSFYDDDYWCEPEDFYGWNSTSEFEERLGSIIDNPERYDVSELGFFLRNYKKLGIDYFDESDVDIVKEQYNHKVSLNMPDMSQQ